MEDKNEEKVGNATDEEIETVKELIKETPLETDTKTQFVIAHKGMLPDGKNVDIGNYISSRLNKLKAEEESEKEKSTNPHRIDPRDVEVQHGVRGYHEKYIEGGK